MAFNPTPSTPPPVPTPPPPPPPPPPPTPTPPGQVTILAKPSVGQLASVGIWTNLYEASSSQGGKLTPIYTDPAFQASIRYTADGNYEIKLPGEDYAGLSHSNPSAAPDDPLLVFGVNSSRSLTIDKPGGFQYSAMGTWYRPDLDFAFTTDAGVIAFGVATPAGAVPTSGAATYDGVISGLTDAKTFDQASNSWLPLPAGGTVALNFDFANSTLGGQMALSINGGMNPIDVGTYTFSQTVFSRGSTTYSGIFSTSLPGTNFFNGSFTGPSGEETIGRWAVPFQFNGENHQAIGAWIARHP